MESLQQTIAVLLVLALLGGTLYWLRSKGLAQFSLRASRGKGSRKIQLVERLTLSAQHSLHLVRVGGRELLIGVSPGGCAVLDTNTVHAETAGRERNIPQ